MPLTLAQMTKKMEQWKIEARKKCQLSFSDPKKMTEMLLGRGGLDYDGKVLTMENFTPEKQNKAWEQLLSRYVNKAGEVIPLEEMQKIDKSEGYSFHDPGRYKGQVMALDLPDDMLNQLNLIDILKLEAVVFITQEIGLKERSVYINQDFGNDEDLLKAMQMNLQFEKEIQNIIKEEIEDGIKKLELQDYNNAVTDLKKTIENLDSPGTFINKDDNKKWGENMLKAAQDAPQLTLREKTIAIKDAKSMLLGGEASLKSKSSGLEALYTIFVKLKEGLKSISPTMSVKNRINEMKLSSEEAKTPEKTQEVQPTNTGSKRFSR